MDIVLHSTSKRALDGLRKKLPQSVLLSGPEGVGLKTIAIWVAGGHLAMTLQPIDSKENISTRGTITVEMIRNLYERTRARHTDRHIVVIDDADRMSHGAQGAFLKLLEEPGASIHFILTSHRPQTLLPTIRSRVQQTVVLPITAQQTVGLLNKELGITDQVKRIQLQFIAKGLPAELVRLTSNEQYFAEKAKRIGDARDLLQAEPYNKLLLIHKYKGDREGALQLIDSAIGILTHSLSNNPQPSHVDQLAKLIDLGERIENNQNIQLQLTRFVL